MGDQQMFYITLPENIGTTGDTFDHFLAIAWTASALAMDVFGMFFWSALGLCFAWTISHG